ncbi:MAG: HlyD family efflux transporter periplasmic adaptor subunit [Rhodanobacteraceae bacterium]|jgi:membrane fusion protein (multidrug efflux system)|nr:HlyD family efflux transporter periplasmic adaptor subunit [Rhodanobacteraceae bacterium]
MSDSSAPASTDTATGSGKRRAILLVIAAVFVLAGLGWYLLWLFVFSLREITDDAYVGGNQVAVSAQVPGTVVAVLADDTQRVDAGQVLVRLDPTDAEVNLAKARSALANTVRQVRQQTEVAAQADAGIAARRLDLGRAEADLARRQPLLADKAISPEEVAHAREAVATAKAALELATRQAAAAHALVDGTDIAGNAAVLQAKAAFREAWINAERNAIVAPVGGYVAQRSVQVGSRVQPGQPLMTVIPLHDLWVDANFKESQLAHIRIGQPATVESDLYGGHVEFKGRVVGLGAGTGSAFALLPPQNASGNWIKVVQRVPVRIALDPAALDKHPLRVGLSTAVKVDTHDRAGAMLAAAPVNAPVAQTDVYARDLAKAEAEADAIIAANLPAAR